MSNSLVIDEPTSKSLIRRHVLTAIFNYRWSLRRCRRRSSSSSSSSVPFSQQRGKCATTRYAHISQAVEHLLTLWLQVEGPSLSVRVSARRSADITRMLSPCAPHRPGSRVQLHARKRSLTLTYRPRSRKNQFPFQIIVLVRRVEKKGTNGI